MTLLLDGERIRGRSMKVTGDLRIESGDMSGQTSNTDTAHKGFKPKTLTVTLLIAFVDAEHLRALMRLAEATESGGQLKTYRIVNDTATAMGMRQVQFSDGSAPGKTTRCWPGGSSSPSPRSCRTLSAWKSAGPAMRSRPRAPRAKA